MTLRGFEIGSRPLGFKQGRAKRLRDLLTWDGPYEIALALAEAHSDVDLETVSTEQLYEWVISLPDFDDDPALVNEAFLVAILREWYEESSE